MNSTHPTPNEVEKAIDKFLEQLQAESKTNYSRVKNKLMRNLHSLPREDDEDYIYEDYDTDSPSPVDEEPEYDSDEEYYLHKSSNILRQQN